MGINLYECVISLNQNPSFPFSARTIRSFFRNWIWKFKLWNSLSIVYHKSKYMQCMRAERAIFLEKTIVSVGRVFHSSGFGIQALDERAQKWKRMLCFGMSLRWSFLCFHVVCTLSPSIHFEMTECYLLLFTSLYSCSVAVGAVTLLLFVTFCGRTYLQANAFCSFLFLWWLTVLFALKFFVFILILFLLNIKKNKFHFPELTLTITKIQLYI